MKALHETAICTLADCVLLLHEQHPEMVDKK